MLSCAAGTDPRRSARTVAKICSVLCVLYNRPIWLFDGRLYSGRRVIALSVLQALWAKLGCQLLTARKSRHRSAGDPQAFIKLVVPVVKRTIFLEALEYLQYSDIEKVRKMTKKRGNSKITVFPRFPFCLSCIY